MPSRKLLEEIRAERTRSGPSCGVSKVLDALKPADRADLESAIADKVITGSQIARALSKRGQRLAAQTIAKHRRGDCNCAQAR